jgi:hypothetical protein
VPILRTSGLNFVPTFARVPPKSSSANHNNTKYYRFIIHPRNFYSLFTLTLIPILVSANYANNMSVAALTTTFTPAPSCLSQFYQLDNADGMKCGDKICQYFQLGPLEPSSCFPSGWESSSTAYFSPGICPSGYTQACSSVINIGTVSETRATCCPKYVITYSLCCLFHSMFKGTNFPTPIVDTRA